MLNTKKAKSKFERAPELTFQDYKNALPEGNQIINVGDNEYYKKQYDPSIQSIFDTYGDVESILTNCTIHNDRHPSLLMSWIPSWKFKSEYICAFHCFAGCDRKALVSFFNMRLAHKLEAIDKYWKERKNQKKESQRLRNEQFRNVNSWLIERGL
jgi:hypothetical protein|tara:strand:- start:18 stop:482 length:465 start_codon:yes stop_codon:yes gene_type:complete